MKNVPTKSLKSNRKKNRRKERTTRVRFGEGATRERARQNGGVILEYTPDDSGRQRLERHRAAFECQLDAYLCNKKIDEPQFKAGMRYREAWLFMLHGVKTRDASGIERIDCDHSMPNELRIDRKRGSERILHQAHKEAGLTIGQLLIVRRVCGEDESVGIDGHIKTLYLALDKLAVYWAFKAPQNSP